MNNDELKYIVDSIKDIVANYEEYARDYRYEPADNEFYAIKEITERTRKIESWFQPG